MSRKNHGGESKDRGQAKNNPGKIMEKKGQAKNKKIIDKKPSFLNY